MVAEYVFADVHSMGFTGMSRIIVDLVLDAEASTAATTGIDIAFPNTFVPVALLNGVVATAAGAADTVVMLPTETLNTYKFKFGTAPGAGTYKLIIVGTLGRRDVPAENPQGARP